MKHSILFMNFDPEERLADMTMRSLYSVVKNSRGKEYELLVLDQPGWIPSVNHACQNVARGDYFIIFSNDVILNDPDWLAKLCIPHTITGVQDTVGPDGKPEVDGSILCIPRSVFEAVGLFDDQFVGYGYSDNDYLTRARGLGIAIKGAGITSTHLEAQTYKAYDLLQQAEVERNRDYFRTKHGLN